MRIGARVGSSGASIPTYIHGDQVNSSVATTSSSNENKGRRHYAYGRHRSGSVDTAYGYTSQLQDSATGLYYYHARYYDSRIGYFISPDPLIPDPTNLLDYNRYAYSRGNPLKYNDPTGHIPYPVTIRSFAPFKWFGGGFGGDDRGYSSEADVTAKVHQAINFDTDKSTIDENSWSSPSYHRIAPWFQLTGEPDSSISRLFTSESENKRAFAFYSSYAGSNPLFPMAPPRRC